MISKIIAEDKIQEIKRKIEEASEIVIVTHQAPDGDAVGASLALLHFLQFLEKKTTVIVPNMYPDFLKWMPLSQYIIDFHNQKAFAEGVIAGADLIIALDFNALARLGEMGSAVKEASAYKILIDHHLDTENFADYIVVYPQISSTSEMIFRVICRMGYFTDISKECAECIYTGMMTDTGAFTFNSNNPEIYNIISELLKKGINKDDIYNKVYTNFSSSRFRLMGYALNEKMKIFREYGTAMIVLTQEEMNRFHYKRGDMEGFVNIPLAIKDIIFSVFIKEDSDKKIKFSFRSRGLFPVNQLASVHFNGGGHLNASGGELLTSMEEAIEFFENILPLYKGMLETEIERQRNV